MAEGESESRHAASQSIGRENREKSRSVRPVLPEKGQHALGKKEKTRESRAIREKRLLAWLLNPLKEILNQTAKQDEHERIARVSPHHFYTRIHATHPKEDRLDELSGRFSHFKILMDT